MTPLKQDQETKCKHVMENIIKNINPSLHQTLLEAVLGNDVPNTQTAIEKFLRNKLQLTASNTIASRRSSKYWTLRGWSETEAYMKVNETPKITITSAFSREFWLERINPSTGVNYTIDEADFERNSRRPIRKEYWMKQGHSEEESIRLATERKDANNKKGAKSGVDPEIRKITSKRCVEYYTARGHTLEEATILVSKAQTTFSLEKCIEKHGIEEGTKIWNGRQSRWQQTLNSKSDEEKLRINKLKLYKKGSISTGEKLLLEKIREYIPDCIHQFTISRGNTTHYVYDIAINNKIIEYNGDYWHCNPEKFTGDYYHKILKMTASEVWDRDLAKIKVAQDKGYEVLVIWENDFNKNKQGIIEQCIQFLTQ